MKKLVAQELPMSVDGQSDYTISHMKKRRIIDLIAFLFWSVIGSFFIVLGSLLTEENIFLRIIAIAAGSLIVLIFLESLITKLTNRIILNNQGIRTRNFIKWEDLSWEEIISFEIEKRSTELFGKKSDSRIIILKINSKNKTILYPLHRFSPQEANQIVELIKSYYKANRGIELQEVSSNDVLRDISEPLTEEAIDSQIPPRVILEEDDEG